MANAKLTATVTTAWWLKPYLRVLAFFCVVMQQEPDLDRLERVIRRAIHVEVK